MYQRVMSLISLLLSLMIVAITARFASPAYSALTEGQRRQVTAEQLASSLRNARTEALLRHQYVVVHAVNEDWSQGWRTILDVSGQGHLDRSNPVLVETQGSGRIPIAGNTPVKHYVRFSPLGEPLLSKGAFQAGTLMFVRQGLHRATIRWCWQKAGASACAAIRLHRRCVR